MLTKERYMTSLESIADYAYSANIGPNGIDVISRDFDELKKLIEEHFTPQPLKFEDLTPGMWVWDNFFTTFTRLKNTYLCSDDALAKGTKMATFYCDAGVLNRPFEENRYYPVQIPWEGDKKTMGTYYRKLQTVKHALQYYITRPNANEKDLVREKSLLERIEDEVEYYQKAYHIPKKEVGTND